MDLMATGPINVISRVEELLQAMIPRMPGSQLDWFVREVRKGVSSTLIDSIKYDITDLWCCIFSAMGSTDGRQAHWIQN